MNKDALSKALSHTLKEIEIPNIVTSIEINLKKYGKFMTLFTNLFI